MYPWLWFWAPRLHFPFSGDVAQDIEPNTKWFFDAIRPDAGVASVEKRAFAVASYGRQLGLITEVLLSLADQKAIDPEGAGRSLERLKSIYREIEDLKNEDLAISANAVSEELERLRKRSPAEFARLIGRIAADHGPSAD